MTMVVDWLCGPLAEALLLALLHSLWQGAVLGTLLLLVLRCVPFNRPRLRYAAALVCLYGLLGGTCLTWSILRFPTQLIHERASFAEVARGESTLDASEVFAPQRLATPEQGITLEPVGGRSKSISSNSATRMSQFGEFTALSHGNPSANRLRWLSLKIADFTPWMITLWMIGASSCLVRAARHIGAARRLQSGEPIVDPKVLQILKQLAADLHLTRPVRLLSVERLTGPCVVGLIKPVILIPAALATGLTPDQWEAILAHELAHIRRWDYLTNLSQLVIEALFFFNPAAWWLSRQIRREREACCDACAVRLTAPAVQYATLLVNIAEQIRFPSSQLTHAASFADERSASLLERVRRIVSPSKRSEFRLQWGVGVAFLVLGLFAVALLQTWADMAVAVAADMLNDRKRVETLVESAQELGIVGPSQDTETQLTIRGTIATEDEQPLRRPVKIDVHTRRGNHTSHAALGSIDLNESSEFTITVKPGITWLQFTHVDFAEIVVGPFGANDDVIIETVQVVLKRGIDVPVTIVDGKGEPVPGARIMAIPTISGGGSTSRPSPVTNSCVMTCPACHPAWTRFSPQIGIARCDT